MLFISILYNFLNYICFNIGIQRLTDKHTVKNSHKQYEDDKLELKTKQFHYLSMLPLN